MNPEDYQIYLLPILIVGVFIWRRSKFKRVRSDLPRLLADGAIIVDVRSANEFRQGSRPGSINIPLSDIGSRCQELDNKQTVVLCCASGSRSGMAAAILKKNGFSKVVNAGPWSNTLT